MQITLCITALCTMYARSRAVPGSGQRIELFYGSAGDQRKRALRECRELLQLRDDLLRNKYRFGTGLNRCQRAVDIKKKAYCPPLNVGYLAWVSAAWVTLLLLKSNFNKTLS